MKIRLDVILFIVSILVSNVVYFSYPPKQVWEKDGNYYDSETHEMLENVNPDNLVYIGQVINGDSYEVYKVLNPVNLFPYILMIVTILFFILVQVLARFRGLNIPVVTDVLEALLLVTRIIQIDAKVVK